MCGRSGNTVPRTLPLRPPTTNTPIPQSLLPCLPVCLSVFGELKQLKGEAANVDVERKREECADKKRDRAEKLMINNKIILTLLKGAFCHVNFKEAE